MIKRILILNQNIILWILTPLKHQKKTTIAFLSFFIVPIKP